MAVSYKRLWKLLVDKEMSKSDLRKKAEIAPNTMTKLRRDEEVSLTILSEICKTLNADFGDIVEYIPDAEIWDLYDENISRLQIQLNDLQLENQILKNILDNAGISYRQELMRLRSSEEVREYDPNQGTRIQAPTEITEKWQLCFIPDSGEDRMCMQKEMKRRILERLAILHNVITLGKKYALKSIGKKLIVRIVNISPTNN